LSSAFGVLALIARFPLMNSCRKYQRPAFTSGTSVVQISLGPFFHPLIFLPPLSTAISPGAAP
jgi:hypothetical protein